MPAFKKTNLGQSKKLPLVDAKSQLIDAATWVIPYGKIARTTGGILGKSAKFVTKVYRNMGR